MQNDAVIVSAVRLPIGRMNGSLSDLSPMKRHSQTDSTRRNHRNCFFMYGGGQGIVMVVKRI